MIHINKTLYLDELSFSSTAIETKKHLRKYVESLANIADIDHESMLSKRKIIFCSPGTDKIRFYTEKLIPAFSSSRPGLMLLFSNPHPESLIGGMFHSNPSIESKNFWRYLKMAEIFDLPTDKIDGELADAFINGAYKSDFQIYFNCFYSFPSPKEPDQLKNYFSGDYFNDVLIPKGKERMYSFLSDHSISSIICFNQNVFNILRNSQEKRNTKVLDKGCLVKDHVKNESNTPIYYVYPTAWYNPYKHGDIERKTVAILVKIKKDILKPDGLKKDGVTDEGISLWQIFHSPKIPALTKDHIVFVSAKEIKQNDLVIYEVMHDKLVGLFRVVKKLSLGDADYQERLADEKMMRLYGLCQMKFQYKIEPIIEFFNRPLRRSGHPDISKILKDKVMNYAEQIEISHLPLIRDAFEKHYG